MRKLLILSAALWTGFAFGQCTTSIISSDSIVCAGDSVLLTANGPSNNSSFQTTLAAGNNHRGNMFDITAVNTITIESFDGHPMANTDFEIYYKVGTYVGSETSSGAWTLVGSAPGVTAQPQGTPTPIPINVGVTIPAGQTYGFYITSSNVAVSLNYTNGTGVGNVFASDANIQFHEGAGMEYPFANGANVFSPRIWNGVIHYSTASGSTTYSWPTGESTQSIMVAVDNPQYFPVDITTGACGTMTDSVFVDVSTVTVDLGADIDICEGDSVTLDAGNAGATFDWNSGAGANQTFTANTSGTYYADVTNALGCVGADSIDVIVHANPEVTLDDTTICANHTLTLDAGAGYASYLWSTSDNSQIINLDGATLGVGSYGYDVTVVDNMGCSGMDSVTVTVYACASLNDLTALVMNVYPNPTKAILNIQLKEGTQNAEVRIIDLSGKVILNKKASNNYLELNLSELALGNYWLEVVTIDGAQRVQIAKN